jgi:multiple sugar transport system substrate-binding protein
MRADLESSRLSRTELLRRAATAGAAVGAGSLLAGAAAQAAPRVGSQETVTLDYWKFDDSGADPAIKKVINEWNKLNPNIQVKLKTFPFGPYLDTVLPTAFAGDRGPDVFWISAGNLLQYVNQGVLEPVNKMINPRRKDFVPIVLQQTTVDGNVVTVPFELTPIALYYRKDSLKAAGVAPPRNWRELVSAAEKLTTSKQYGVVVEPAQGTYQWFTFMPFIWMTGAETMNPQWTKSMLLPRAAAAFQLWGDLINKGYAPKKLAAVSADIGPMGRGESAMHVSGYWSKAQLEAEFPKVSWGVVPLPPPPGRRSMSVGGGWMQAVNNKGDHVQEALAFTEWMWFKHKKFSHDWSCVANSEFSSRYSVNRGCAKIQSGPVDRFFRNIVLPSARPEPRYPDQIVKAIGDGLQAAMFGGKSGPEAAKIAADGIDKYLKTYKGERVGR